MENVIITIARQYGSGGKTIGEMFAKKNNMNCYNREILRMASDDSGIDEKLFNQADEKLKSTPLFGIGKNNVYRGELIPPKSDDFVSNDNLFNYQAKIIKEIAEKESCVMIGRCADFVLRDNINVVSVFIHAPKTYCMARALERSSLGWKDMEKYMARTDKYRGDYYKYYTGHDWNDARNYDLCLDSSKLGFDKCVEEIESYIKIRFGDLQG